MSEVPVEVPPEEPPPPGEEDWTEGDVPPPTFDSVTPDTVSESGVTTSFPLPEGDFFTTQITSPHGHSGDIPEDAVSIALIQEQVGAVVDGVYSNETASAVRAWRISHQLDDEVYVDQIVWEQMMRYEKDASTEVGVA